MRGTCGQARVLLSILQIASVRCSKFELGPWPWTVSRQRKGSSWWHLLRRGPGSELVAFRVEFAGELKNPEG